MSDDEEFTREQVVSLLLEVMHWTYVQAVRDRPMTDTEKKVIDDIRTALAAPQPEQTHPGYVIGSHWLETAYSRICAGEAEADVLRDCGWERVTDAEALRRDAERYRYLRNRCPREVFSKSGEAAGVWIDCEDDRAGLQLLTGDDADAAIDAAMKQEDKP